MIGTHRFAQFTAAERAFVTTSAKSEHTCVHKVPSPPWSAVLLRQQRLPRKTKTSHCCQFYKLIAKHEVKISENQAAGVVFREEQETFLFCGQQAESAFTRYIACDQGYLSFLCQQKSCGFINGKV